MSQIDVLLNTDDNLFFEALPPEAHKRIWACETEEERMRCFEQEVLKITEKAIGDFILHAERVAGELGFWVEPLN